MQMLMGQVTALRYLLRPGSRELVWYPMRQHLSQEVAYSDRPKGFCGGRGTMGSLLFEARVSPASPQCVALVPNPVLGQSVAARHRLLKGTLSPVQMLPLTYYWFSSAAYN